MQIKLFPEENAVVEVEVAIRSGRVGPIRFAATATSFSIVRRALTELVPDVDDPPPAGASQG